MNRAEAIAVLKGGQITTWNRWRDSTSEYPDLSRADLSNARLNQINLSGLNLSYANFSQSDLSQSDLRGSDLTHADLTGANLCMASFTGAKLAQAIFVEANLTGANLQGSYLSQNYFLRARICEARFQGVNLHRVKLGSADLSQSDFSQSDLSAADLRGANLRDCKLSGADFTQALCGGTQFNSVNLLAVKGLETCRHRGPSSIDTHTLSESHGSLPTVFLRGCGLQRWEIEQVKLYNPGLPPKDIIDVHYHVFDLRTGPILSGCFISYSHEDEEFVDHLHRMLQAEGGSVWLDKHNFLAGSVEQNIDMAIRINDIVLLVLSGSSLESDWVWDETESALEKEQEQHRTVVCPIAIDDSWKTPPPNKRRLMRKITERIILDFSDWRTQTGELSPSFHANYRKLIDGMKIHYGEVPEVTG